MASGTNFYPLMALLRELLFVFFEKISEWLHDQLDEKVKEWYAKALTTENPWDDFFIERLAYLLKIDLTGIE